MCATITLFPHAYCLGTVAYKFAAESATYASNARPYGVFLVPEPLRCVAVSWPIITRL